MAIDDMLERVVARRCYGTQKYILERVVTRRCYGTQKLYDHQIHA